jgi:hypothetical protein
MRGGDPVSTPRSCYWINESQEPDPERGYIPSVVTEGEPGHSPLSGNGAHAAPWYWGNLESARRIAFEENQRLGLTDEDVMAIVLSSMAAQPSEGSHCVRCGTAYDAPTQPQCECAGDPPVDKNGVDYQAYLDRVRRLRYDRSAAVTR